MTGLCLLAGWGLSRTTAPEAPAREVHPLASAPPVEARAQPLDRPEAQRLLQYSARATPLWMQLGTTLTAMGQHSLALHCEEAQQALAQARAGGLAGLSELIDSHEGALNDIRAEDATDKIQALTRQISGALDRLRGTLPTPAKPAQRGAPPVLEPGSQFETPALAPTEL